MMEVTKRRYFITQIFNTLLLCSTLAWAGGSDFNGTTSVIQVPHQTAFESPQHSMGCWVRYESFGEGNLGRIFDTFPGFFFRVESPDRVSYNATAWDGTDGNWRITTFAATTWGHLLVTYDASSTANDPAIYLNGVAQSVIQATGPTGTYVPGTADLYLGNTSDGSRTFDGQLAECVYYDRVLSPAEVRSIAFWGPLAVPRGLILYMPLGVYGAKNYTRTPGLHGTATAISLSTVLGPPIGYASQSEN